jgi:ABC-2 type transport system permease protein
VGVGLRRGVTVYRQILTSADGIWSIVFWNGLPLLILLTNRDTQVPGTDLSLATVALPGFLGLIIAAAAIGPAYYIAAEREDGTIVRARAVPFGIVGYVTGLLTQCSLDTLVGLLLLLVPGLLLIDAVGVGGLADVAWFAIVAVLGLLASLPIGIVIGSIVRSPRVIGGVGFLVIGITAVISGILIPLSELPPILQLVGQLQPAYWIGLGMRAVFLPESAAALEIGGSWRYAETLLVLGAWTVAGLFIAPRMLRRLTRRAVGSALEEDRRRALQRV